MKEAISYLLLAASNYRRNAQASHPSAEFGRARVTTVGTSRFWEPSRWFLEPGSSVLFSSTVLWVFFPKLFCSFFPYFLSYFVSFLIFDVYFSFHAFTKYLFGISKQFPFLKCVHTFQKMSVVSHFCSQLKKV